MTIKVLKTDAEYRTALDEAQRLVALDPASGTSDANSLELLALLISDYEAKHFPLPVADPIEAIQFRMEQLSLAQRDLLPYIGSKSKVSEVLGGKRRLTLPMIRALSAGLGIPLRVLVQSPDVETLGPEAFDWKRFPIKDMAARGYFGTQRTRTGLRGSAETLVREFLAPLGSRPIYAFRKQTHHVRSGRAFDEYGLFGWTAQVMRQALAKKPGTAYRAGSIDDDFMRQVAQLSWSGHGPVLAREFLAQHGISLIIERHLPKTYLDGAALLLADPVHPVIGMTLRYDRLDNFWHCLMHELAHIRLHLLKPEDAYYDDLDRKDEDDPREIEADDLAQESLVPSAAWERSAASDVRSPDAAISLAKRLHVHPAVVAGRMRRHWNDYTILTPLLGRVRPLFPEYQEQHRSVR